LCGHPLKQTASLQLNKAFILKIAWVVAALLFTSQTDARPLVVAHRGASAYLPEHTLPAYALAHGMGADYIEQDVVLTKDGVLVVLHDLHIDEMTDVAKRYPRRARANGRYYAIDFTWEEIRTLQVRYRQHGIERRPDKALPVGQGLFSVLRLEQVMEFISALNRNTGRSVGLCIEVKDVLWHTDQGQDLVKVVHEVLDRCAYTDPIYVQCFEQAALKRLKFELGCLVPLAQLMGKNEWGMHTETDYDQMDTVEGLRDVATYAKVLTPSAGQIITGHAEGRPIHSGLVERAHAAGLQVHAYTFRRDQMPSGFTDYAKMVKVFAKDVGVDALLTDFPDLTLALVGD
jgi:glycerophosphoryl diester phosphodiesterase